MHRSRPVQLVALLLLVISMGCQGSRSHRATAQTSPKAPASDESSLPSTTPLRRQAFASTKTQETSKPAATTKAETPVTTRAVAAQNADREDALIPAKMDELSPSKSAGIDKTSPATVVTPSGNPLAQVKQVLDASARFDAKYPDFVCRLTRTERIRNTVRSPEIMLMKFRRKPRSVYLQWLDPSNDGRATVWVDGENKGKMISRGGKGDLLLAGKTMWLDPNGSLARSKSTQPITDTGFDKTCAKIWRRYERLEHGDKSLGTLSVEVGPDPDQPGENYNWIVHQAPPGVDDDLPDGGVHRYGFRQDTGRLEVCKAYNPSGQNMYIFRFERFIPVTDLTDNDFNPDQLWPRKETQKEPSAAEQVVRGEVEGAQTR